MADFGESRRFDRKDARRNSLEGEDALSMTMVGTKLYCAPEVMMMQRYNESVARFACVANTLITVFCDPTTPAPITTHRTHFRSPSSSSASRWETSHTCARLVG